MSEKTKIALIYGSTREGRFCDIVGRWATTQIEKRGEIQLDVIDPAKLDLPSRHEKIKNPAIVDLEKRLEAAEAFIILVPEYNHSFPAAIKFVIDSYTAPWKAKPVGFICYGGISGGLRAVEQLRVVFAELHAVTIRDTVSFSGPWSLFDATGELKNPEHPLKAITLVLNQLLWWADALRMKKAKTPY